MSVDGAYICGRDKGALEDIRENDSMSTLLRAENPLRFNTSLDPAMLTIANAKLRVLIQWTHFDTRKVYALPR